MRLVVLFKVVPDTETQFQINQDKTDIVLDSNIEWIIAPYDENALEEAIRTKEKLGGTITIVTIGTGREAQVIQKALAMGADTAVWLKNEEVASFGVLETSKILAKILKPLEPDIIFCGREATDTESSYIGSALSELLSIGQITDVNKLKVESDRVIATRDNIGRKEVFEAAFPVILTIDWGINEPRYPKLPDIMKAKRKKIEEVDSEQFLKFRDTGANIITQTKVIAPTTERKEIIFQGDDIDDLVQKLTDALVNKEKVI